MCVCVLGVCVCVCVLGGCVCVCRGKSSRTTLTGRQPTNQSTNQRDMNEVATIDFLHPLLYGTSVPMKMDCVAGTVAAACSNLKAVMGVISS